MVQTITSANTSINSKKLPAVYKKIDFSKFQNRFSVLDYGCGKFNNAKEYINSINGIWYGYDPYNRGEAENSLAINSNSNCIICSNVLNVLFDAEAIFKIVEDIYTLIKKNQSAAFITVYEGDKSRCGKITKKDCYQRNELLIDYLKYFDKIFGSNYFVIKKGVITNCPEFIN